MQVDSLQNVLQGRKLIICMGLITLFGFTKRHVNVIVQTAKKTKEDHEFVLIRSASSLAPFQCDLKLIMTAVVLMLIIYSEFKPRMAIGQLSGQYAVISVYLEQNTFILVPQPKHV